MNLNNLLNQVLGAVQKNSTGAPQQNTAATNGFNTDTLLKIGGGAAAASVLSMIFKGKGKRKSGNKLLQAGSMAAIGALAWQAYQTWQRNQAAAGNTAASNAPVLTPEAFQHQGASAENAGRIILRTMVAAAASDGLIDETERALIQSEADAADPEAQQWLAAQLQNPATVADLAREIGNQPALAAEAYLAARMVCGDLARKEIVFLSQLSQALGLDEKWVETLEQQAGF
ncbi:tellurite resistance TerB family protein [Uruburuella testudinis]|uniref:Tellurite resistance TerB family protein n=1 Tax=Uruburuella testudinis TaxID=1282863 RepID=A0ABY4DP07_9NEIS|nr:DUF533 domain-containing protein [Uruburuella testudinis]UOO80791.1 tellurite resistance TerB family protein [Uruburuella testudinis]